MTQSYQEAVAEVMSENGRLRATIGRLLAALRPFAEADFENWMATADCTVPDDAWRAARDAYMGANEQSAVPVSASYDVPLKGHCGQK